MWIPLVDALARLVWSRSTAAAPPPQPKRRPGEGVEGALFIVVKGYHMGSKWFATEFRKAKGCNFHFEYERCLRVRPASRSGQSHRTDQTKAQVLVPGTMVPGAANQTVRYLEHVCGCRSYISCLGCQHWPPPSPPRPSPPPMPTILPPPVSLAPPPRASFHAGRAVSEAGEAGERALAVADGGAGEALARERCRASGISIASLSPMWVAHLRAVMRVRPAVRVVVQVRSNHVKHALSLLRTSCEGQPNHIQPGRTRITRVVRARLHVPPALLLAKAVMASRQQQLLMEHAAVASGGRVAYHLLYERMQADLAGEVRNVLRAVGAPRWADVELPRTRVDMVKAGAEDARSVLVNYGEVRS